jgi:hypothetical protein
MNAEAPRLPRAPEHTAAVGPAGSQRLPGSDDPDVLPVGRPAGSRAHPLSSQVGDELTDTRLATLRGYADVVSETDAQRSSASGCLAALRVVIRCLTPGALHQCGFGPAAAPSRARFPNRASRVRTTSVETNADRITTVTRSASSVSLRLALAGRVRTRMSGSARCSDGQQAFVSKT